MLASKTLVGLILASQCSVLDPPLLFADRTRCNRFLLMKSGAA
jgi:hypothetical protein